MSIEDQNQAAAIDEATQQWREVVDTRFKSLEDRLGKQDDVIDSIAGKLEENTKTTQRVEANTATLVGMLDGLDKLGTAINWIARKTRPVLLWVAAVGAAWTAWKTGVIGPK